MALAFLLPFLNTGAQVSHKIDSLTQVLQRTTKPDVRFELYRKLVGLDPDKRKYKSALLLNAETSFNTELQLKTYLLVIEIAGTDSTQFYLDKMFALAKEDRNLEYQGWYYLSSGSMYYFTKADPAKAMEQIREATSIAEDEHLDSLAFEAYGVLAQIYRDKGERLLEYRAYQKQLSLAENVNGGKAALIPYWQLFWFYNGLKHYLKAKEYALKILDIGKKKKWPFWIEGGNHLLTHYYTNVGEFETAKYYYDETNKLRKQNGSPLTEDDDLLDIYYNANNFTKLLEILKKDDIKKNMFQTDSSGFYYYGQLAGCYIQTGARDSALHYLQRMKNAITADNVDQWQYYSLQGNYFKLINKADSAAICYAKADSNTGAGNNLEARIERYANLDTLFTRQGNYQKAYYYKTLWMQYRDSLTALSKEGDLVVLEIESENQRQEAEMRASHNLQYMGITAGLASVFVLLVLLGVFSSSTSIIRGVTFFAFIFFFEFLILLFDNFIHKLTHGEPWKVLAIKIALIAFLLPLHHFLEHKLVHHLVHRKKLNLLRWKKKITAEPAVEGNQGEAAE